MENPYTVLGVSPSASLEDIKLAWKRLARINHPDRAGGSAEKMANINAAYSALCDVAWRAKYDESGDTAAPIPIEIEARSCIMQMLVAILAAEWEVPVYKGVLDMMEQNISEALQRVHLFDRKIKKLTRQKKSLRLTEAGKNTLSALFDQMDQGYCEERAKYERKLEILNLAKSTFKDLAYEGVLAEQLMKSLEKPAPAAPGPQLPGAEATAGEA